MKIISNKRCVIGEGPIWNAKERLLYFVNGAENEICILNIFSGKLDVKKVEKPCYALCFDKNNNLIVSREDGIYILQKNGDILPLYDTKKFSITSANDMKVGPDGRIYVGTISECRKGVSNKVDGKLFSIDKNGAVKTLLDGMYLSNGLEWSMDGKRFYHTDSVTGYIKEYSFDKQDGTIQYTGRKVFLPGVDGFTIDLNDRLVVTQWDEKQVCFVDTKTMQTVEKIAVPNSNPASCCFAGEDMKSLIIVTANFDTDIKLNFNAGYTFMLNREIGGRLPFLFGN